MASSGSTKDLSKTLTVFLRAPSLPLPSEVLAVIAAYLEKHGKLDDATSDRINEELVGLYEKNVQNRPDKYAPFLAILRELRPAIRSSHKIFEWWNKLLDPVLEHVDREKGLAQELLDHTLDLLSIDQGNDASGWSEGGLAPFINRLLNRWLEVSKEQANSMSPLTDLKERMTREALLIIGKKDPRGFMTALDAFVVKRDSRNNAFRLLCDFVASQPPHLHLILQTPLFVNILHSLQHDESTSTVNTALLSIIMLLPFMPSSLVPFLPTLFNIYARLVFWDMDSYFAQEHTEFGSENESSRPGFAWEKSLLDPDYDGRSIHYLPGYFTILYGLYPINFVDYIRKPQRYLRHANNADDIDVQAMEIRDRSERFREKHRLHPNFYNLTIESEKTDFSRWIRSEADEVLADCMALLIQTAREPEESDELVPPPGIDLPDIEDMDPEGFDLPLLSATEVVGTPASRETPSVGFVQTPSFAPSGSGRESIRSGRRGSHSSHPSGLESIETKPGQAAGDSPTLPPHLVPSPQLKGMIHSNKVIKTGLNQSLANDSVPSLALSPQDPALERRVFQPLRLQPPPSPGEVGSAEKNDQAALLYHQNLLLLNDLQFERYIKQQHMTHMGELRRKQIREAATEAETQNLVMANRSLKQRLDEAKRQEGQIRKEFEHRRAMAQKRENDLSARLRTLREEQKRWNTERTALRQQLETAVAESNGLRAIVSEAEKRRLQSDQDLEAVDLGTEEISRLKAEISRLSIVEHEYQGRELKMARAMLEAEAAGDRATELQKELEEREGQLGQLQKEYHHRISVLETRLDAALKASQHSRTTEATAVFESTLAAHRTRQAQFKKQYVTLMEKYNALQVQFYELQGAAEPWTGNHGGTAVDGGSAVPIAIRSRGQRGLSDTEAFEAVSHNATSPLEPISTPVGSGGHHDGGGDKSGTSTSPQMERYFGRGGVQNAKKDRKDKKDDKGDKKDKKPASGLRGIRNFV
ncbi:tuberous sclerosis 1 protein [Podospora conica]|nr:tuberous sclerosis 1 protein [Schizothecium conicum]